MDHRDAFYDHLDEITGFNEGWKNFINSWIRENERSNKRLCGILTGIKGKAFVTDLRKFMRVIGKGSLIRISRKPAGMCLPDKRWKTIPQIWVDVRSDEAGMMSGYMYIQVKPERYLKIHCSF